MTIERLNQYRALLREIKYYERKITSIRDPSLRDSVLASTGPAHELREVSVFGSSGRKHKYERFYRHYLIRAEAERDEIEAFIASVGDSQMRQIIRLRFVEGLSWQAVADVVGGSENSVRMQCQRYVKNCSTCSEKVC